jgi:hypothetical protein
MVMLLLKENPTTKQKMNSFSQKTFLKQTNTTQKTLKFKKQPPNLTSNLRLKTLRNLKNLFFKAAPSRLSSAMPSSFASVFCRVSLKLNETFVIAAILILPPPVLLLLAK